MDSLTNLQSFGLITSVISVGIVAVVMVLTLRMLSVIVRTTRQTGSLMDGGETAEAMVINLTDTGTMINDSALVDVVLQIEPTGRDAYQTQARLPINKRSLSQVQPGQRVMVEIDRTNPYNVAINLN